MGCFGRNCGLKAGTWSTWGTREQLATHESGSWFGDVQGALVRVVLKELGGLG